MEPLEWVEEWSVGNESLDHDHKCLVDIINRVSDVGMDGADPAWVISELRNYANYHFRREEEMMEAAGIDGLEEHKKAHQSFVDWLTTLQSTINLPEARFVLFEAANEYLRDWLGRHILGTDMQYKGKL